MVTYTFSAVNQGQSDQLMMMVTVLKTLKIRWWQDEFGGIDTLDSDLIYKAYTYLNGEFSKFTRSNSGWNNGMPEYATQLGGESFNGILDDLQYIRY